MSGKLLKKVGICCLLIAAISLLSNISYNYSKHNLDGIIYTDMEGYYMYLPAVFIYHGFENVPIRTKVQFTTYAGTNKVFTKYTCGVALLQLPFFAIAHGSQMLFNPQQADGYSNIYSIAIIIAASFYSITGLCILYFALRRRFSIGISLITTAALLLGSNMYYYTICQPGMSHIYSFFLFSIILYLTPDILNNEKTGKWILYGLTFGLVILTRPTNSILLLYPLLYNAYSFQSVIDRLKYFIAHIKWVILAGFCAFAVFIPQLLYWKYLSGGFILYSYQNEHFAYWKHPKISKVLFDVQNGWLLYSPLFLLALIGFGPALRKKSEQAPAALIILTIATYLFASWWAWWFGGAFGHRCYVEYYTILSFLLAAFLVAVNKNIYWASVTGLFIVACIIYNLKLTYLYQGPWDGPDWNWQTFAEVLKHVI